jgi:hypothetical protein
MGCVWLTEPYEIDAHGRERCSNPIYAPFTAKWRLMTRVFVLPVYRREGDLLRHVERRTRSHWGLVTHIAPNSHR